MPREIQMKRVKSKLALAAVLALAGCAPVDRARETANPSTPARALALQVCSNCHGADGNSDLSNFPNIAAQTQPYFVKQLTGFRAHNRPDPADFEYMWGLSRYLTDEQIKGLAAYYAAQSPRRFVSSNSPKPGQMDRGREMFQTGVSQKNIRACVRCHGKAGEGDDEVPRIANQHAAYVVRQLLAVERTQAEPQSPATEERAHELIAKELTREDVEAVAGYLEALPVR